ncbi:S8 family serine peptidase [Azorhizobium caulinodans]|nr:S8 family serine peptidase [Azorhizobium caulinodans]
MPNRSVLAKRLQYLLAATALSLLAQPALAQSANSFLTPEYYRSGALAQVNAAAAYALGFTGAGVTVAVVDSGLDTRHPEFTGRIVPGYDFAFNIPVQINEDHDTDAKTPTNSGSHGTHVAGIIAAARNGTEMQGVAYNANILPVVYNDTTNNPDTFFSAAWNYVAAQNVAIASNSLGLNDCVRRPTDKCNVTEYTRAEVDSLYPTMLASMRATAAAGTLMVFATGNEAQSSPDVLGGMPYLVPELKNNWLAVGAVDANNTIANFSNRCGVAKDWCLVAPGVAIYSTVTLGEGTGTDGGYGDKSGTSMATPVVSGVAALVKEAFPWFTAYDLQQALLTTATDLGAPGVDDVYGWGLVNAAKAVLGYGQFVTTTTLDTKGYSSTFSNDISGTGGLIKAGAGTLTLIGTNTYSGGTTIAGGTLQIGNGGTTGSITGNVLDNGTLAFNRSDALTYGGVVSGAGNLVKAGAGTLTLTGANTYTGGTTISSGTLQIGNGGTTGAIVGNVANSDTLAFKRSDTLTFGGAVSGTGRLVQAGTGTTILTGTNTYTGGTTISSGTLQIGNGGTTGSIVGNVVDNGTLAFNRSDSFIFSGAISGTGNLVKDGAGTLSLTGNNSYTGLTAVIGGQLSVNGAFASQLAIGSSGTLRGTGTLNGPLVVAGRLAPGNSPGTLTVAGPVTFASGSTFQTDIDGTGTGTGAGNYSRLVTTGSSGTVTVTGGTITPTLRGITGSATNSYTPSLGSSYTVIQTSAGLAGSFSGLAQPASGLPTSTRFDALYTPTSLSLVVTPLSYGTLAANGLASTANTNATGAALDSFRPTAGVAMAGTTGLLFGNLYTLTPAALPYALAQLSGEAHASAAAQVFEDARQVRSAIYDRLDGSAAAKAGTDSARLSKSLDIAIWATGYGGWGNASGSGAYKLDWTQSGFIGGADVEVFGNTRLGLALGTGSSAGNVGSLNSTVDNSHTDLAAYGATRFGALLAKYGVAYSWNNIDTSRTVAFSGLWNQLGSSADGNTTQVFGELSYDFRVNQAQVSPFASVAYVKQDFDAFHETGGAAALYGSTLGMTTTLTTVGARVSTDIALGNGTLTPSAKLGWQHAFGDTATGATMWFAGSNPFLVTGTPIARDALALNLGLAYGFTNNVSASVAYDGVLAADAQDSTLKANLKVAF